MNHLESSPQQLQIQPDNWRDRIIDNLHDRYNQVQGTGEEGFIGVFIATKIGRTVLAATLAGGALTAAGFLQNQHVIVQEQTVTAGTGMLKEVFVMPPKECHGGYIANVAGSKAELNIKIQLPFTAIKVPTSMSASESFTGDITNEVCNTGKNGEKIVDTKNHTVTVTIPPEALETTVYQTNPTDANAWTSDNGAAAAILKNSGNIIKAMPFGLDYRGGDQLQAKQRGWAMLTAYNSSTKGCGNTAWPHLKPKYGAEVIKGIVEQNNSAMGATQITDKDVTLNLPDTVSLKNQYDIKFTELQKQLVNSGVTLSIPDPTKFVCRDMPAGSPGAK